MLSHCGHVRFTPESGHTMKTIGIVLVARWGCQRHRDNYVDTLRKVINGSRDFGLFCGIFRTPRSARFVNLSSTTLLQQRRIKILFSMLSSIRRFSSRCDQKVNTLECQSVPMCSAIRATVLAALAVCISLIRTAHAEFFFWPHHGSWWGDHTPFGHSHKHRHTNPGSTKESQSSQDVPKGPTSAVVGANKPVPNVETVGPPADSERAIEKPAGSDGETGPIPLK